MATSVYPDNHVRAFAIYHKFFNTKVYIISFFLDKEYRLP